MKTSAILASALLALAATAHAVPTEINYQGVLTDQNGNPVNGVRAMQIKIYDAPTGGTLLYSEDLGNVPVQDGIYSFSFGANGTSNALTTETVAIANGTVSTFQKVLAAPTVVAGSVTVTDGTYTWDQTNGSSNENDFSVAYSPNLRRVTVTYYNGNPAAGKTITAKFRAPDSGITGALAEDNQPWIEVSLAGVAQTPRQKVLAVPYARRAASVELKNIVGHEVNKEIDFGWIENLQQWGGPTQPILDLPFSPQRISVTDLHNKGFVKIPNYVKIIYNISFKSKSLNSSLGSIQLEIKTGSKSIFLSETTTSTQSKNYIVPVNLELDPLKPSILYVTLLPAKSPNYPYFLENTGSVLEELRINALLTQFPF